MICTTDSVGWPDRWVGWHGWEWWLEFKENSEVKPHQKHVLDKLRAIDIGAWVIRIRPNWCDIEYPDGRVVREKVLWDDVLHTLQVLSCT